MPKQLLDLFNEVLLETGRRRVTATALNSDQLSQDEQMVLNKINNEVQEILEEWEWQSLKRVTTQEINQGEESVELTGDSNTFPNPYKINWVAIESNSRWEELQQIDDNDFDNASDGIPREEKEPDWYRLKEVNNSGNPVLELYPTPSEDDRIKYRYYARFEKLDDSDDYIPVADRAVMWGATASVLRFDGESAQYALQKYNSNLRRSKQENEPNGDLVIGGDAQRPSRSNIDFGKPL